MKLLLLLNPEDKPYLARLSSLLDGHKASCYWGKIETLGQIDILVKRIGAGAVVTNRDDILALDTPKAKLSDFMGSIIDTPLNNEMLVIPPLKWLVRVTYGEWLVERYLSKVLTPERWYVQAPFTYTPLREVAQFQEFYSKFDYAVLCSIDIETLPPHYIRSVSYTLKFSDNSTATGVFPLHSMNDVHWMRAYNDHPVPKVCQNGKYECAHFHIWGAPMANYVGDTLTASHATWSELPKDLNFVASIFLRKHRYWKDMREAESLDILLEYNALDTWSTCEAFCSWLMEAPQYALTNYIHKWPQVILSHEMEMRGLKRDTLRKDRWKRVLNRKLETKKSSLVRMVRNADFNPASPVQVKALLKSLTGKDWPSSDEKNLNKVLLLHPLNERLLSTILDIRGEAKLISTYLGDKDYKDRWLYTINPHGTDTGRDNSKSHHFWCGQNIQNVPGEAWQIKNTVVADEGYELYEADYGQAEARGVAYCSGDEKLIEAVESGKDFHSLNASAFFGVPYDEIYSDAEHKTLDKPLRDLAKRVNHGANYNMGEQVLIETMSPAKIREAQRLLGLPSNWTLHQVAAKLLSSFELAYPKIKTRYYKSIIHEVRLHSKLVGATGWTRYCFGKPWENKPALNSYVAHVTQSLNAMILDEASRRIFRWRIQEDLLSTVRVNAKIHDSILFQVPISRRDLAEKLASIMSFPVPVTDCAGITRDMVVPVDLKYCGHRWESYQ